MGIAQGATPYLMVTVEGWDLSDARKIFVTLESKSRIINLDLSRVTVVYDGADSLLTVHLKQEETLSLPPDKVTMQIRWEDAQGEKHTTKKVQFDIESAIYKGVI